MVAFYPDPALAQQLAIDGGLPAEELHVTLCYLGDDLAVLDRAAIEGALAEFVAARDPIEGVVNGCGMFHVQDLDGAADDQYASVLFLDLPRVSEFREDLRSALLSTETETYENHSFSPHMTLGYYQDPTAIAEPPMSEVSFGSVWLSWGEERLEYPLGGVTAATFSASLEQTSAASPSLVIGVDRVSFATARYMDLVLARGLQAERGSSWPLSNPPAEPYGAAEVAFITEGRGWEVVLEGLDSVSFVAVEDGQCFVRSAATSGKVAADELTALAKWLGRSEPPEEGLNVRFWAMGSMGPFSTSRPVDAPAWAEVESNYPAAIRGDLGGLMVGPLDLRGGQMMIWHGPPGTGKTWALRALGREWAEWCDFEYVADPDRFLEEGAAYLLQVLLEGGYESDEERWRLLVLEDAGELLAADARDRVGQGLSRFLNAADGFIGQGLRTIMLVTTNEPMESMHPAVSRPGRCFASIEFGAFPAEEAGQWLNREVKADLTLAEMYAESRKNEA